MKNILFLVLLMFISIPAIGQSAQGRYSSRMTPDGTLFFINPHKLGDLSNLKRFEYDMTMLTWTDSVTINFTFESQRMSLPDNFKLVSNDAIYECDNYSSLYVDIKKNHYEVRITSKFPVSVIENILANEIAPIFTFSQDGILEKATYRMNAWKKDRKKLLDIFKLFTYSKL